MDFYYDFLNIFNRILGILFFVAYFYQIVFLIIGVFLKPQDGHKSDKKGKSKPTVIKRNKICILIPARNEENVIGHLIESLKKQDYPSELIDIFVIADNCTDKTAEVSRQHGAEVVERFNKEQIGMGYAIGYFFQVLRTEYKDRKYDAYIEFNADNLLMPNFVTELNKTLCEGYDVVTSCRNSKNPDQTWVSMSNCLYFLREAFYLNNVRMKLGTNCAISGTGFIVSADVIEANDGWKNFLMTEDLQFTVSESIKGRKIGYCGKAEFYDEPTYSFKQSLDQRIRWIKGGYQVFAGYGGKIIKNMLTFKGFHFYDFFASICPLLLITIFGLLVNVGSFLVSLVLPPHNLSDYVFRISGRALFDTFSSIYLIMIVYAFFTVIKGWKIISGKWYKKVFYCFAFPFYIFALIPLAIKALFAKVEWKPIVHTEAVSIDDIKRN